MNYPPSKHEAAAISRQFSLAVLRGNPDSSHLMYAQKAHLIRLSAKQNTHLSREPGKAFKTATPGLSEDTAALMFHLCQCTLRSPLPGFMLCTALIASKQIKYMTRLLEKGEKKGQGNQFSASLVTSITSPNFSSQDGPLGDFLAVTGQAKKAHKINKTSSEIPPPAVFTC